MTEKTTIESLRKELEQRTGNLVHEREFSEITDLGGLIGSCKSFVDCGASRGPYTWAANLGLRNACITAIEANPALCEHLLEQWDDIKKSGTSNGNELQVINAAISDKPGKLDFFINREDYHTSYIGDVMDAQFIQGTHERIELPALSLDHIFDSDSPEFIKIDIEGAEWRALKGAIKLIEKRKTRFLVEIHPWGDASNGKRPSDVFSFMAKQNYSVTRFSQHWLFTPEKPSVINHIQSIFYGFVLDHPPLRKLAKAILRK